MPHVGRSPPDTVFFNFISFIYPVLCLLHPGWTLTLCVCVCVLYPALCVCVCARVCERESLFVCVHVWPTPIHLPQQGHMVAVLDWDWRLVATAISQPVISLSTARINLPTDGWLLSTTSWNTDIHRIHIHHHHPRHYCPLILSYHLCFRWDAAIHIISFLQHRSHPPLLHQL